jgi:putative hemolysin
MSPSIGVPVVLLAIAAYAIVNSVEIAVVGVSRIRVHHLAEEGSLSAQALVRLLGRQERFFAAIVLLQNLFVVLASAMGSFVAVELVGGWGVAAATVLVASVTALFGEVTPKVLAARASERFALLVALPVEAIIRVLSPVVALLSALPSFLSRVLFGIRLEAGPSVSEAELRMLIDISALAGEMNVAEAELLDRVFHFGDRRVHEVMIPRTEVACLPSGATLEEFYKVFAAQPHSRFPVYKDSLDNVVGVVGIKEVLRGVSLGTLTASSAIDEVMRAPYFVPETKLIGDLFREMQATGRQMAIAVDEWGGTAGVVTAELLLEEMVGRLRDELWPAEREVEPIDETTARVDGGLSVEEAREQLGLHIPEGPYDTIAGFLLDQLGHIPRPGEQIQFDGHLITVSQMKGYKIEELRVSKL